MTPRRVTLCCLRASGRCVTLCCLFPLVSATLPCHGSQTLTLPPRTGTMPPERSPMLSQALPPEFLQPTKTCGHVPSWRPCQPCRTAVDDASKIGAARSYLRGLLLQLSAPCTFCLIVIVPQFRCQHLCFGFLLLSVVFLETLTSL